MSGAHILFHLIRANFLERVRRRGFLVVLLSVTLLSLAFATGRLTLRLDKYVGAYNSAWVRALVAGSTTLLLCFANFFVVKNAIELDRRTGVGELILATPMGKFTYLLGKTLSNFTVLLAIEGVLFASAILAQLLHGDTHIEWLALLLPFVFIALPAMATISALAVLFEVVLALRSGFGNFVFVSLYIAMIVGIGEPKCFWLDLPGVLYVDAVFTKAAQAMNLPFWGGFSVEGGSFASSFSQVVRWENITWVNEMIGWRLYWFGVALGLTVAAALLFNRFDSSRGLPHMFRWSCRRISRLHVDTVRWTRDEQDADLHENHDLSPVSFVSHKVQLSPVTKTSGTSTFLGFYGRNSI